MGTPLANTRVFVLDDRLELAPIGVTGEMCVAGACVARGYLNQPELTAKKFIPDRYSETANSPLYRTGDLARYRQDGTLELIGRRDNQIKLRGFRIELQDVEAALLRHQLVSSCAISLHEDETRGKYLVAYLVAAPELSLSALRRFLSEQLPVYMVPTEYVWLDRLPLTANGKLDRQALPDLAQSRPELDEAYVAPRTPLEHELATAWREVLGIERIGVDDNFFELGGHSLQATQLASKLSEKVFRNVSVMEIFSHPSIADFAEMVLAAMIQEFPDTFEADLTVNAKPVAGVVSAMPDEENS